MAASGVRPQQELHEIASLAKIRVAVPDRVALLANMRRRAREYEKGGISPPQKITFKEEIENHLLQAQVYKKRTPHSQTIAPRTLPLQSPILSLKPTRLRCAKDLPAA